MSKLTQEQKIQALNIVFVPCDHYDDEMTIKEYCKKLLIQLFIEREGFSGKRPFGNSDWDYPVAEALWKAGFLSGTMDRWECLNYNDDEFVDLMEELIKEM